MTKNSKYSEIKVVGKLRKRGVRFFREGKQTVVNATGLNQIGLKMHGMFDYLANVCGYVIQFPVKTNETRGISHP